MNLMYKVFLEKYLQPALKTYLAGKNDIHNSLIANFSIPKIRPDIGALWENFLVSERNKEAGIRGTVVERLVLAHGRPERDSLHLCGYSKISGLPVLPPKKA